MRRQTVSLARAALGAAALTVAVPGAAQDASGGLVAGFDVGVEARAGSGVRRGESGATGALRLGADLASVTRLQSLRLTGSTQLLAFADPDGDDLELGDILLGLDYDRAVADGSLGVSASLREQRLDGPEIGDLILDPDLPFDPDLLDNDDGGVRRLAALSARLEIGQDAPLGFSAFLDGRRTSYDDLPATSTLEGSESVRGGIEASARLAEGLRATLGVEASRTEEGDETRRTERLRFGLDYEASERLTLRGSVSEVHRREEVLGATTLDTDDLAADFSFDYALPRGALGGSLRRTVDDAGSRDVLRLTRRIDLPGGDGLDLSLGAVRTEDDVEAIGGIVWERAGPRGGLTLSLDRAVGATTDGELATRTGLAARLTQRLNGRSTFAFDADYTRLEQAGGTTEEAGLLRATLSRELTRDWRLSGGIEHRIDEDDDESSVFLNLSRRFEARF